MIIHYIIPWRLGCCCRLSWWLYHGRFRLTYQQNCEQYSNINDVY